MSVTVDGGDGARDVVEATIGGEVCGVSGAG